MGVGYCVSPLHRVRSQDFSAPRPRPIGADDSELLQQLAGVNGGSSQLDGPVHVRSPDRAAILAWRNAISTKYRAQLGSSLSWDEDSALETAEEVGVRDDTCLRYVAALLDLQGPAVVRSLVDAEMPSGPALHTTIEEAAMRGFSGGFPHLLLGVRYWLPYRELLIIEEADWYGDVRRFGSVYRVLEQIKMVRGNLQPARRLARGPSTAGEVLSRAWRASGPRLRLSELAAQRHLPLWTTD